MKPFNPVEFTIAIVATCAAITFAPGLVFALSMAVSNVSISIPGRSNV